MGGQRVVGEWKGGGSPPHLRASRRSAVQGYLAKVMPVSRGAWRARQWDIMATTTRRKGCGGTTDRSPSSPGGGGTERATLYWSRGVGWIGLGMVRQGQRQHMQQRMPPLRTKALRRMWDGSTTPGPIHDTAGEFALRTVDAQTACGFGLLPRGSHSHQNTNTTNTTSHRRRIPCALVKLME